MKFGKWARKEGEPLCLNQKCYEIKVEFKTNYLRGDIVEIINHKDKQVIGNRFYVEFVVYDNGNNREGYYLYDHKWELIKPSQIILYKRPWFNWLKSRKLKSVQKKWE